MEKLVELVNLVNKNKVKGIRIIDHRNTEDRLYRFYEQLTKNEFKSDDEAAKFFFSSNASDYKYRRLKNRLKERLYNTLFFIDVNSPKFNDHQRAFYNCQKNLMTIRLLLARYGRNSAIELARKTLRYSEKYELSEITASLYETLRSHYATHTTDRLKYERAKKYCLKYTEIVEFEKLAERYYDDISIDIDERKASRDIIERKSKKYLKHLNDMSTKIRSYRFNLIRFFLALQQTRVTNDYHERIKVCDSALAFFAKKSFVSNQFLGAFEYNKLLSFIQLAQYDHARTAAKKCLSLFEMDTIRWFNTQEYLYILYTHLRKYESAYSVFREVTRSKYFKFQFQQKDEIWRIKEAFLFLAYKLGKLQLSPNTALARFKVHKFLNEVPIFSSRKRSSNIPILIVQIIVLIVQKRYDELTHRIEAIEKYSSRYLRKDNNFRSNCFIKMLVQIPKHRFHQKAVIRNSKKYIAKLKSMPLQIADQSFQVEVIPYEHLWDYVLESLDNKFH